MQYDDFLKTVLVIRNLYGHKMAVRFFEENIVKFPDIDYAGITSLGKKLKKESS